MPNVSRTTDFKPLQLSIILLIVLFACSAKGQTVRLIPINIYGDGNPENGIEDSREKVFGHRQEGLDLAAEQLNAGTIKCDGKIRGTAMVVDTSEFATELKGVVIVTAAHIIYDLRKKRRFKRCVFNFLGLGELSSYRARIDLKNTRMGGFDPNRATDGLDFGEGDWGFLYVPKPWKSFNPKGAIILREYPLMEMETFRQSGGELRLIAFDSSTSTISVSKDCTVIESNSDDLGGGAWPGQLLDDCDSADGASGGGIVAVLAQRQYLIGIRSGSHWSEQAYPASEYPMGPPDGSVWNRHSNTNFGRAVDAHMLRELGAFVQMLEAKESLF